MFEFMVVEGARPDALVKNVRDYVVGGWEPLGGIAVVVVDKYYNKRFYQSMIRQVKKRRPKK